MLNAKKMDRFISLLLITLLCVHLVWTFPGCKDETEANEPNDSPLVFREVWLSVELEDEPTFEDGSRVFLYKSDEFDIVIEKKEPNEPKIKDGTNQKLQLLFWPAGGGRNEI